MSMYCRTFVFIVWKNPNNPPIITTLFYGMAIKKKKKKTQMKTLFIGILCLHYMQNEAITSVTCTGEETTGDSQDPTSEYVVMNEVYGNELERKLVQNYDHQ